MTGLLPGLGSAQAAVLGQQFIGDIGDRGFLVLTGGINTVNFLFSLAAFYTIEKARNGAIVAVMHIVSAISKSELFMLLAVGLIVGAVACVITLKLAKLLAEKISFVNYTLLISCIIGFVVLLVFIFSTWWGLLVLFISTMLGLLAPLKKVPRNSLMGCLMLPVIVFLI